QSKSSQGIRHAPRGVGTAFRRKRFRQHEIAITSIRKAERRGRPKVKSQIDVTEIASERRTHHQAQPKRSPDKAERLCSAPWNWRMRSGSTGAMMPNARKSNATVTRMK